MADLTLNISQYSPLQQFTVRQWETFSPDDQLIITDKINLIVQTLNRLGKLSNDVVTDWNKVMTWVSNDGMTAEVDSQLQKWKDDGTLVALINAYTGIGDLSTLQTVAKDSLVNAINENVTHLAERAYKSVKLFGAKGDGSTDDTTAIQSALNSGFNIYFPNGTYMATQINMPSNISIIGSGNSIIKAKTGMVNGTTVVRLNGVSNVYISNLVIDGNSSVNTSGDINNGISIFYATSCNNIQVLQCTFQNNKYAGTRWDTCTNIRVDKNQFYNTDTCVWVTGATARFHVLNNTMDAQGNPNSEPITFYGNALMQYIVIDNNIILNKTSAIGINLGYEASTTSSLVKDAIITNNIIDNVASGILVQYGENIIIANNKISNCTFGIRVIYNATQIKIENNLIRNTQKSGIATTATTTEAYINNNILKDCNLSNDAAYLVMLIYGSHLQLQSNLMRFTTNPSLLTTCQFNGVTNSVIDLTGLKGTIQLSNSCSNNVVTGTLKSTTMTSILNNTSIDTTTFTLTNDVNIASDSPVATAFGYLSLGNAYGNPYVVVTPSVNGQGMTNIPLYKAGRKLTLFVDYTNSQKQLIIQRTGNIKYTADITISADTLVELVSCGTYWRVTSIITV